MANRQSGAAWLHRAKNQTSQTHVWGEKERELRRLAEKWEDDGIPFEEVLERIRGLRAEGGTL